jgi:hypothetical protein
MARMKIVIDKKPFTLRFGFKSLMILGELRGLKNYSEVIELFSGFSEGQEDFKLDQLQLIEDLVKSAARADPSYYSLDYSIDDVVVIDHLMNKQADLNKVIENFLKSFPAQKEGKQKPQAARGRKTQK